MSTFTAHTKRDGQFAEIRLPQNLLLELIRRQLQGSDRHLALAVLFLQYQFTGDSTHAQDAKVEELAAILGINRRTVFRSIERLQAAGILYRTTRLGRHAANGYRITDPATWQTPEKVQPVAPQLRVVKAKPAAEKGDKIDTPEVTKLSQKGDKSDTPEVTAVTPFRTRALSTTSSTQALRKATPSKPSPTDADGQRVWPPIPETATIRERDLLEAFRGNPDGMTMSSLCAELRRTFQPMAIDYPTLNESLRRLVDEGTIVQKPITHNRRGIKFARPTGKHAYYLHDRVPRDEAHVPG